MNPKKIKAVTGVIKFLASHCGRCPQETIRKAGFIPVKVHSNNICVSHHKCFRGPEALADE